MKSSLWTANRFENLKGRKSQSCDASSTEQNVSKLYDLPASKLPSAPPQLKQSKQFVLLKSALNMPRGSISRVSLRMRQACHHLASASAKLAQAHKGFGRSKSVDYNAGIWMVVNPMFNQPESLPGLDQRPDAWSCDCSDGIPAPLDTTFEEWESMSKLNCPAEDDYNISKKHKDGAVPHPHYRTRSLGDLGFWELNFSASPPNKD